jgi:hypothetical protein
MTTGREAKQPDQRAGPLTAAWRQPLTPPSTDYRQDRLCRPTPAQQARRLSVTRLSVARPVARPVVLTLRGPGGVGQYRRWGSRRCDPARCLSMPRGESLSRAMRSGPQRPRHLGERT